MKPTAKKPRTLAEKVARMDDQMATIRKMQEQLNKTTGEAKKAQEEQEASKTESSSNK